MTSPFQKTFLSYLVAAIAVGVAVGLRLLLDKALELEGSFLLFFAAVMVASWFGGLGPGLFATFAGALANNFFLTGPRYTIGFESVPDAVRTFLYFAEGTVISVLATLLHRARRRAEASEADNRDLERRILAISDEERRRIGHDLHDGLGQQLTGIAFLSKALQGRLVSRGAGEAGDAVKIAELVSETIGWTRDLARGLEPVGLDAEGLNSALRLLAANTTRLVSIDCSFQTDLEPQHIRAAEALHLYRIAQEAVNNAVKHARAQRIEITLSQSAGVLRMSVDDDGVGLQTPLPERTGTGLQIMRYRARMMNADLSVGRGISSGTSVVCMLPLTNGQAISETYASVENH